MYLARRVVVTGLGVVAPNGVRVGNFWNSLCQGVSGIQRISKFDASKFACQIAGEVRDSEVKSCLSERDVVRTDPFVQFALVAGNEALNDAKLLVGEQPDRIGVSIGTAAAGITQLINAYDNLLRDGPRAISPYTLPASLPTMAAGWLSIKSGARGVVYAPSTACAAGAQAIGEAFRAIQTGAADAMLAGGSDAPIHPLVVGSFCAIRALSTNNNEPIRASRPFDLNRDGFILSEGSGVVVLENLQMALSRSAHVYAEIVGYGLSADGVHATSTSRHGPASAMKLALKDAKIPPEKVDYINAHGTGTRQNDANETNAIKEVFGRHAKKLAVSSTKSMTGHLLGAAGAVEAVASVLAIRDGVIPPTINWQHPDPECDLDYVVGSARTVPVRVAMSNSFAFGGTNVALVFTEPNL